MPGWRHRGSIGEEAGEAEIGFDFSQLGGGDAADGVLQATAELLGGVLNEGVHCASLCAMGVAVAVSAVHCPYPRRSRRSHGTHATQAEIRRVDRARPGSARGRGP